MVLNANTRISAILRQHPGALEAIISISPKFEKLRNPLLRKLMAPRASIEMASKIAGCSIHEFYERLQPLGFEIANTISELPVKQAEFPRFISTLRKDQIIELDVRPILSSGNDPLQTILEKTKSIKTGQALKIINTFKPEPLINLLGKKGFITFTDVIKPDHIETYFYKEAESDIEVSTSIIPDDTNGWDAILSRFNGKLQTIDVRDLEMPQPMVRILEALEKLHDDKGLYVYHKRIPVFLLPELAERKFGYRINEISESEVHLLIFKEK